MQVDQDPILNYIQMIFFNIQKEIDRVGAISREKTMIKTPKIGKLGEGKGKKDLGLGGLKRSVVRSTEIE